MIRKTVTKEQVRQLEEVLSQLPESTLTHLKQYITGLLQVARRKQEESCPTKTKS